jgi:hypothetical protein
MTRLLREFDGQILQSTGETEIFTLRKFSVVPGMAAQQSQ